MALGLAAPGSATEDGRGDGEMTWPGAGAVLPFNCKLEISSLLRSELIAGNKDFSVTISF